MENGDILSIRQQEPYAKPRPPNYVTLNEVIRQTIRQSNYVTLKENKKTGNKKITTVFYPLSNAIFKA